MDIQQEEQATPGSANRPSVAGGIGNVLEWYDSTVYAFFAGTIGRLFFPQSSESDTLIAAFGVFAAGYLMRPLGDILFGHIGDRYCRKPVLVLSNLMIAVPTCAIGLLPTAEQIGPAAAPRGPNKTDLKMMTHDRRDDQLKLSGQLIATSRQPGRRHIHLAQGDDWLATIELSRG